MAYTHQQREIKMLLSTGTGSDIWLTSGTTYLRHICTDSLILRRVVLWPLVVGVTAGKPTIGVRKVTGPATTTATGTAITGATITLPAANPAGKLVEKRLSEKFAAGDHIVMKINTAATKALTCRVALWVEPTWETAANISTKMVTVTA